MTFEEWLIELRTIIKEEISNNELITEEDFINYTRPDNWIDYFNEDYTPQEAFDEDKFYWSDDSSTSEFELGSEFYTESDEQNE